MKYKSATDFRKSLEARIKGYSQKSGEDLQRLRRKIAFDRLLSRVFSSEASFFLKGGYAMELRFEGARTTKDIDLTFHQSEVNISQKLREISQVDLNDYFVYRVGEAISDLENAPYGGARFGVSSFVDGRLFVRFQLDVGVDVLATDVERVTGKDWLDFCGVPPPVMSMISLEQQFAEKIHAYSLPRGERMNTRVKDLIDLVLLIGAGCQKNKCFDVLHTVFNVRKTHPLPDELLDPPLMWVNLYKKMAIECHMNPDIGVGFKKVNAFYKEVAAAASMSHLAP